MHIVKLCLLAAMGLVFAPLPRALACLCQDDAPKPVWPTDGSIVRPDVVISVEAPDAALASSSAGFIERKSQHVETAADV